MNMMRFSKYLVLSLVLSLLLAAPAFAKLMNAKGTIVYAGDSRFARMYNDHHIYSRGDVYRFSKNSITADKYTEQLLPGLCKYLDSRKHVTIVACIGINDLLTMSLSQISRDSPQIRSVFGIYRMLIQKYAKAPYHDSIFIKSVDPTGKKGYPQRGYQNSKVKRFNSLVRKSFRRYYMDSYTYIWKLTGGKIDPYTANTGSYTVNGHDGLHYNRKTNRLLHKWIRIYAGIDNPDVTDNIHQTTHNDRSQ